MTRPSDRRSPFAGNRGQGMNWINPKTRRRIYWRDGFRCVICNGRAGVDFSTLSLDHVVPRARGGSNRHTNLITCCLACNEKRGDTPLLTYCLETIGGEEGYAALDRWFVLPNALP